MKNEDIILDHFNLISLFHPSNDDLQYLKTIENNRMLCTLMIYVGKRYAYLIQYNNEYIGFLVIVNDPYNIRKELFLIFDELHQHNGFATLLLKEVTEYLLEIEKVDNIIITLFNKKIVYLANKIGFEDYNGFKRIKENKF